MPVYCFDCVYVGYDDNCRPNVKNGKSSCVYTSQADMLFKSKVRKEQLKEEALSVE